MHLTRKLTVAFATLIALSGAAAPAAAVEGPCTDADGVTVVVDLTDLGGEVETGCAIAPATGTDALQEAGFADTRDDSGLICAIDSQPDPCPAEFTGSYWSYWHAERAGEWETYTEGSDTAVPAPGSVEGWRYFDGSAGPTAMTASATEPTEPAEAAEAADEDSSSTGTVGWIIGGLVVVVLAAAVTVVVRRRGSDA